MSHEEGTDRPPEMSFRELEEALSDENHPRHAEAERIMDQTVRPAMKEISKGLMPKLPTGGFKSLRASAFGDVMPRLAPSKPPLIEGIGASQQRMTEMMDSYYDVIAEREAAAEAEKDEERQQREADRIEARRQHNVMLGLTIASVALALIATAAAVVALFVTGS